MRLGVVYLAGPMRGLPDGNRPEFYRVAKILEDAGLTVVNPATIEEWAPESWNYNQRLRAALRMLLECDSLVLLPGWEDSFGACEEKEVANAIDMGVYKWTEIERSLRVVETPFEPETMDSVSGVDTRAEIGTTADPAASEESTDTAHVTGLPSAELAIRGYTRLVEQRLDSRD